MGIDGDRCKDWDEELIEELNCFDDAQEAINRYGEPYLNSIVWDNNPPFPATVISSEYAGEITHLHIKETVKHPVTFLINKWWYISNTLGISDKLITSRRGVHGVDDITQSYGALQTNMQNRLREYFFIVTDNLAAITLRPALASLLAVMLLVVCRLLKINIWYEIRMFLITAAYYSSF